MKSLFAKITASVGLFTALLGMAFFINASTQTAAASSCDKVNIVYCGLTGSDVNGYISSIKQLKTSGSDGNGHADMGTVLSWGGYTDQVINGMNSTNTKVGTLNRDGSVVVDGKTVATGTWLSARFTDGTSNFQQVSSGVWTRLTTTSMMNASDQVLVTFDADGKAIAGTVIRCGNMLRFTPVIPAPVNVCNPATGAIISVPVSEAGNYVPVDSPKCKDISICELSSKQIVTIKQATYDNNPSNYSTNPLDCEAPVVVCNPTNGQIITVPAKDESKYVDKDSASCKMTVCDKTTGALNVTINKDQFDSTKYSTNENDCVNITVCVLNDKPNTKVIRKSELDSKLYSTDLSVCTPPLPSTGPGEIFGGLMGSSALTYGAYTYTSSRGSFRKSALK